MKLAKPKLSKPEAALEFAVAGKKKRAVGESGGRVVYPPEGHKRLTINLPISLHKKLRLAAMLRDTTATDLIQKMLEDELVNIRPELAVNPDQGS